MSYFYMLSIQHGFRDMVRIQEIFLEESISSDSMRSQFDAKKVSAALMLDRQLYCPGKAMSHTIERGFLGHSVGCLSGCHILKEMLTNRRGWP